MDNTWYLMPAKPAEKQNIWEKILLPQSTYIFLLYLSVTHVSLDSEPASHVHHVGSMLQNSTQPLFSIPTMGSQWLSESSEHDKQRDTLHTLLQLG